MDLRGAAERARTGFWHLRKGGLKQFAQWRRRNATATRAVSAVERLLGTRVVSDVPPARRRVGVRPVVAAILDDFSAKAWGEVFDLVFVGPTTWRQECEQKEVELLFVESAWHGNSDRWQYQLTGSKAPSEALRELVQYCRSRGIPTVFWNKEDPPHFEDFIGTAKLFDQVFTTDENLLEQYRLRLGHDRVGVLPFAAADHLHNPVRLRQGHQSRDVAFAGTYFAHKFPERRAQMDLLLGGALDASPNLVHGLEIFSRFEHVDERYRFPPEFASRVIGSLDYADMLVAYKAFKVFLNVNSVTDSPSMCARRIFEILATGTPVVTTWSEAIRNFFASDELPIAESRKEAAMLVRGLCGSPELRDRTVHKAQRAIWESHTYRHRAQKVLDAVGLAQPVTALPKVTALVSTNRPQQVEFILSSIGKQTLDDVQVALVTHGFDLDEGHTRRFADSVGISDLQMATMHESYSLGACLRRAVELADGDVLSKMDDDDHYGPHYLRDLVHALSYSGADIVGKQAHYMYLHDMDALILRFPHQEHRWSHSVMGPTITGWADVFREHPFSDLGLGEDTDFLRRVIAAGGSIYSSDRFNFVQNRSTGHTWDIDDVELLASGEVKTFGAAFGHVMF